MSKEAMKLALEALDIVNPREFAQADPDGKIDKAITALRLEIDALNMASTAAKPDFWEGYVPEPVKPATEESSATQAQQALDKKAENARELGLDYEPAQQETVAWPCLIAEADFSEDTVTLAMQCTDYKVSAGKHWLSNTPPAQRTWVGLTDEEIDQCLRVSDGSMGRLLSAIEAKLRSKNNG